MNCHGNIVQVTNNCGETEIDFVCKHEHGRSAVGSLLECADCKELFPPRNFSETSQVALYGHGQSLRGFTSVPVYGGFPELGLVHD